MDTSWLDTERLLELATTQGINILGALLILLVGKIVAGWARKVTVRALSKTNVDPIVANFAGKTVGVLVIVFAVIAILNRFGIQTASVIAVIGAAGLAVGLALQGTLSNFASGVMLLIFRPFKIGDAVSAGGQFGIVESMDLFTTALDTLDNKRIIIPNGEIYGSVIENYTHNEMRRVDINVGTDYSADLRHVRQVLEQVPERVGGVLTDPAPQIFLHELGDSSINWQVRVWCETENYWDVWQETTEETKKALDGAGVGIPFPQMDVHLDKV
ncbi:MAG: mechanosensitive ion channel [Rhodothermales bacterium]|nr:mechanosensitive ion channel [Rhodothermales bacterium]